MTQPVAVSAPERIAMAQARMLCLLSAIELLSQPMTLARRKRIGASGFAQHVIDILNIAPVFGIAVLQPEDAGSNIRRHVFDVVHDDRLFGTGRHEDLHCIVVIAVGSLVERARRGD
jgi:hypothetical protein